MPKGDRTGPVGTGARSGRMAGFCSGFEMPGYANTPHTMGMGMGRGRRNRCWGDPVAQGQGLRRRLFSDGPSVTPYVASQAVQANPSRPEGNIDVLKHRSRTLQAELDALNKGLQSLEAKIEEKE